MNFIQESAKAIVAFLLTMVVVYLAKKGVLVGSETQAALVTGISGLVVAIAVWFTTNKSK